MKMFDAQAAMGWVVSQTAHIEAGVYQTRYADIQYPQLVPVDTSAHPFARTVTYYSANKAGLADWLNLNADDIPMADVEHSEYETPVFSAGIGYGYSWEEINQAQQLGYNLSGDKANAARRAAEEMTDRVVMEGDTSKNMSGLIDHPAVTATPATTGDWDTATEDEIIADVNQGLELIQVGTNNIIQADTLLLPYTKWNKLASTRLGDNMGTVLEFIRKYNVYTANTGAPLTIRGIRKLDDAGVSATARMVAYRRSPEVLKFHMPMPHRFLPVWQEGPLRWQIPGVMRLGGLDVRLPNEVTYIDGI